MAANAGGKQPNETVDLLKMAYCPSMAHLTLTVTTDMRMASGGPRMHTIRMWVKQWTFTANTSADGTSGCTVTDSPPLCISQVTSR